MGPKIKRQAAAGGLREPGEPDVRHSLSLPDPAPGYQAKFGRGRWSCLDEFDEDEEGERYELRHRVTSARIEREGAVVGAIKLVEYDIPPIWASWFCEAMDGYSSATADLAHVLLTAWPDLAYDVACYGRVLELNRLWVEPGHSRIAEASRASNRDHDREGLPSGIRGKAAGGRAGTSRVRAKTSRHDPVLRPASRSSPAPGSVRRGGMDLETQEGSGRDHRRADVRRRMARRPLTLLAPQRTLTQGPVDEDLRQIRRAYF